MPGTEEGSRDPSVERQKEASIADDELTRREEWFKSMVESSLQGTLVLVGPPFSIRFVNNSGSDIFGCSGDELQALPPEEAENLIHWIDRPRVLGFMGEILARKKDSLRTEARFNKKNGDVMWLDVSMTGVRFRGSFSIVATFIDITQQKQAIEDLVDSRRDLELVASLLRHDLRNDLQIITGNTEVMRLAAQDNETIQQFAEANIAGVRRMLELLKIFGKPEKEKQRLIAPILEDLSVEATRSYVGMVCQLHVDPDVLMTRVVGGMMLPMVFRNLISNSAKYAGERPRVDIRVSKKEDNVEVTVSDNGPGIPDSIRPRLFEKGVSTSGGGLGLYLSKRVVEAYGGTIELLDPKDGKRGATFRVELAIAST